MHALLRQSQQSDQDAAPKVGVKLSLIIYDVHKPLGQIDLHMEVGEVGRNAAAQTLLAGDAADVAEQRCSTASIYALSCRA